MTKGTGPKNLSLQPGVTAVFDLISRAHISQTDNARTYSIFLLKHLMLKVSNDLMLAVTARGT